jgi:uncharacterized protein YlzI (FlbEa/FlbD family)
MRGIDNKKFFMTLEEFENLVNKENNELINGKKIIVDEKILSEIDSFKNYSFKIEKDEPMVKTIYFFNLKNKIILFYLSILTNIFNFIINKFLIH